ncbi:MAG TPA: Uma2 family endonuclease [Thermoanaerobacterium sp.]|nr:Uma2 family endonuclease [Thermoanaerobacterium sp.]
MALSDENKTYTYRDYKKWKDDRRWELINGNPFPMAPPSRIHQEILREILTIFSVYLKDKSCKVYSAPFGVRLPKANENDDDIETVVEPDIVVVCDKSKLDDEGCKGAPDLVVEIVSPSTARNDKIKKFNLYEMAGVKEYWIVEPDNKIVTVFTLDDDKRYGRPGIYSDEDKIKVSIFEDLIIDLKSVFTF